MRSPIILAVLIGCAQPPPLAEVAFTVPESTLIPEGIAHDPVEDAFYIGSTNLRKIVRVGPDGAVHDFVGQASDGLWGVLGISIDAEHRILWAASSDAGSGMPIQDMDPADEGRAGVFKYDLASGTLIKKYLLDNEQGGHFLNDLTVTADGTLYVTDSSGPGIYRIDPASDTLELMLAPSEMPSPNGITWAEDRGVLFVAFDGRLGRVAPGDSTITYLQLPDGVQAFADGLYYFDDSLIAVWPFAGFSGVTRFELDPSLDRVVSVEPILSTHPTFLQPTTGAIRGDAIYVIANSQLQLFRAIQAGDLEGPDARLVDPVVLRVDLRRRGIP